MRGHTRAIAPDSIESASVGLERLGFVVHRDASGIRPSIIAHHPTKGVLAIDPDDGDAPRALTELNRKVELLREEIPAIRRIPVERRIIDSRAMASDRRYLTIAEAASAEWVAALRPRPIDERIQNDIAAAYRPAVEVKLPIRSSMKDSGAKARGAVRLRLDREQESVVLDDSGGVVVVTGPPGSGKTLVLVARAKRFALDHPDWTIQLLCFNNMLIPYLRSLVGPFPNIDITTFGKFAHRLGFRVSLQHENVAASDVAAAIPRIMAAPPVDAVLIDEAQDFLTPWIEFAVASVKPGRGGVVLAGDPKQSLYGRETVLDLPRTAGPTVRKVLLKRPYRSTRQILAVTSTLSPASAVEHTQLAFDGEPVDLIFAHDQDEQAKAVARHIVDLLRKGERKPQDIGVLVTRKWRMGKVALSLEAAGVPQHRLYANQADDLDLTEPTVKVMTVHSAKGLDFDVVFLVGLEDLPDDSSVDSVVQARAGYVGTTRAKDQLVITYSRDNAFLERIRALDEDMLSKWVWPDDFNFEGA